MDSFQIRELIVIGVYADGEEETRIAAINKFLVTVLYNRRMNRDALAFDVASLTSTKLLWYFESLGAMMRCTSPRILTFSSSS